MARLFEQTTNTNPNTSKKIAFGKAGTITENMSLAELIVWLNGKLSFLIPTNNLSDISDSGTACSNLGTYTKTQIDATTNLVFDYTDKYLAFGDTVLNGRKNGKIFTLSGSVVIEQNGSSTPRKLCSITGYVSPGYDIPFAMGVRQIYEGANGYIDVDGNIYLLWGQNSSGPFRFGATWIIE